MSGWPLPPGIPRSAELDALARVFSGNHPGGASDAAAGPAAPAPTAIDVGIDGPGNTTNTTGAGSSGRHPKTTVGTAYDAAATAAAMPPLHPHPLRQLVSTKFGAGAGDDTADNGERVASSLNSSRGQDAVDPTDPAVTMDTEARSATVSTRVGTVTPGAGGAGGAGDNSDSADTACGGKPAKKKRRKKKKMKEDGRGRPAADSGSTTGGSSGAVAGPACSICSGASDPASAYVCTVPDCKHVECVECYAGLARLRGLDNAFGAISR